MNTVQDLLTVLQTCDTTKQVQALVPHFDPIYFDSADTNANMVYILVDDEYTTIMGVAETDAENNIIKDTLNGDQQARPE